MMKASPTLFVAVLFIWVRLQRASVYVKVKIVELITCLFKFFMKFFEYQAPEFVKGKGEMNRYI